MKKKIISTLLILIGLALLLYPKAEDMYAAYQQEKLLKQWQQSMEMIGTITVEEDEKQDKKNPEDEYIQEHQEGILTIEKIDLKLPILKGATRKNMLISVTSLENTGRAGEIGNYALSAHRNHTYGKNFNRLDELAVGDKIEVDTGKNSYEYTVVKKIYVKPEELWVLDSRDNIREITLITCHPMIKPTQRLIIKGELNK